MKNILKLTFLLLIVTSCTVDYEDSKIDNPESITTLKIQNSIIDSCATLSYVNGKVYVMDDQNKVEYRLAPINSAYIVVDGFIFFIMIMIMFIIIIIVLINCQ